MHQIKTLNPEDYETVGGLISGEIIRLRINRENYRVIESCSSRIDSVGTRSQRIINQYRVVDSKGNERYAAVARQFPCILGSGLSAEVILIGLEKTLEMSEVLQEKWANAKTDSSQKS